MLHSKAGISEMFEGHHGPITGIHCHTAAGPLDFSHLFVTSSFDWTVKLWSTKVWRSCLSDLTKIKANSNSLFWKWCTHSLYLVYVHKSPVRGCLEWIIISNIFFISSWINYFYRTTSRCTHLKITLTMSMMSCGPRPTLLCLLVWMEWAIWTCGTSTMTLRYNTGKHLVEIWHENHIKIPWRHSRTYFHIKFIEEHHPALHLIGRCHIKYCVIVLGPHSRRHCRG